MNLNIVILSLFFSVVANADVILIQKNEVYSVEQKDSAYSSDPIEKRIKNAQAAVFVHNGKDGGYVSYIKKGLEKMPTVELSKKPTSPKIEPLEGCGKNPRSWLYNSKVVGQAKKANSQAVYLEIPSGFTVEKTVPADFQKALSKVLLGDHPGLLADDSGKKAMQACLNNTLFIKKDKTLWAAASCGMELNEDLMLFEKTTKDWTLKTTYTLTEECP